MQPIRTVWSHRVAVTACDSASRCHRVVPLGHTDRAGMYISTGEILEISSNLLSPCVSCSAASGLRIVFSSQATSPRDTSILHHAFISIFTALWAVYTLCHNTYAYSLLFYKVYMKRENAGSWNSGLEKGANIRDLFCTTPKVLKLHESYFWK